MRVGASIAGSEDPNRDDGCDSSQWTAALLPCAGKQA